MNIGQLPAAGLRLPRKLPWRYALVGLAGLALILLPDGYLPGHLPEHLRDALWFALVNLKTIAPVVLVGLLITAGLTATGAIGVLVAAFDSRPWTAIGMVSLIGALLPVCGITVLPLVAGLLGAGVALGPVMAFLLSSAVTSPDMFAVTAATLGWTFATVKTLAAFAIGVLGGGITWLLGLTGCFARPLRRSGLLQKLLPAQSCGGAQTLLWRFWRDPQRLQIFGQSGWSMAKLVVLFLGAAFVAEYFLQRLVPEGALAAWLGEDKPYAIPLAALIAAPLYLDGYAALPLVRGLMDRGMSDGAAMSFLIAGGIISAWTAIPVFALVRTAVFCTYCVLAITGAMLAGWVYWLVL